MAAASPAQSNSSTATAAGFSGGHRTPTPTKSLRGLNKPKCIQCGNVARSRCPYQSCKSCCSKAQNPCYIHVLKANTNFPDKTAASGSSSFNQQSTEPSSTPGTSHRSVSLRQLSSNFAQFNNVQMPIRSKKPLTKKDAAAINEWRFAKFKEFQDRNIETENEAFDRYLQNINLLEDVFSVESLGDSTADKEGSGKMISEMKLKLRSNPARIENFRKRIKNTVDEGLKKLKKQEAGDGGADDLHGRVKLKGWEAERASGFTDLNDKLSKARNEEDLKACLELKAKLHKPQIHSTETEDQETAATSMEAVSENDRGVDQFCPAKMFRSVEIDQEVLNSVEAHFSSLEEIEDL